MTIESGSAEKSALALLQDRSFQLEAAQIRAKAVLSEIIGEAPAYRWSYVAPRVVRKATATIFDLQQVSADRLQRMSNLRMISRQIAQLWESLGRLEERTSRNTALLNAAAAYQLAGYQANAACLARKLVGKFSQIDEPTLIDLGACFLQRLFIRLQQMTKKLTREPTVENDLGEKIYLAAALGLAGEGLSAASGYFLSGDEESFSRGRELLKLSERGFVSLGLVKESNFVHSLTSLLPVMHARSTWTALRTLVPENARWDRYLKLLARGIGQDVLGSPSISELWPSQLSALDNQLLGSDSKIVKMPTSAGKTRVAEIAIAHTLISLPGSKCVYVAPYRALVAELQQTFLNLFADLGFQVSSILGTYESDDFEQLLASNADLLVVTPEKLDLLQRLQPDFLAHVRLFILDEGHLVHDVPRGIKYELLLTRIRRALPSARFLFLSAVIPKESLNDFSIWLGAKKKDIVTSEWRPSVQRLARLEWAGETGVLHYSQTEDVGLLQEFVPGVIRQQAHEFTNPKTGRINRRKFPEPQHKAQTAAELAFKFSELGPVLVFCSQRNFVEAVAKAVWLRLSLLELERLPIPGYFRTENTRAALISSEWLGDSHRTTQLLRNGIAIHHGRLPDIIRNAVEADFRERRYRILIATNTLAQGVNLPIRTVVIHSCWRSAMDGSRSRITARDYWNIAGRAGRAREETEGTTIHIVANEQDRRDYEDFLAHRDAVEPIESGLFQLLKELVGDRLSEETLAELLDPEILELVVEEGSTADLETSLEAVLNETLVKVQAERNRFPLKPLQKVFRRATSTILERVADAEHRALYATTGLRTQSCELLRRRISENKEAVQHFLLEGGLNEFEEAAQLVMGACLEVYEMQPEKEFAGNYVELLSGWLRGSEMSRLRELFGSQAPSIEDLAEFIEDFFAYRLPWGISAYIRIATKVLGLQAMRLSHFSRFFPSMVKFGVPMPEAAWAMAAGIPFRRVAIAIASRYLEQGELTSYNAFQEWLMNIDADQLQAEFGLSSPLLEDVSRALVRSAANPLLNQFDGIERLLPIKDSMRGVTYGDRKRVAQGVRSGMWLSLERDYDNLADHNAVVVKVDGQMLGYLSRTTAQLLAPEMDSGTRFNGRVISVSRELIPTLSISQIGEAELQG